MIIVLYCIVLYVRTWQMNTSVALSLRSSMDRYFVFVFVFVFPLSLRLDFLQQRRIWLKRQEGRGWFRGSVRHHDTALAVFPSLPLPLTHFWWPLGRGGVPFRHVLNLFCERNCWATLKWQVWPTVMDIRNLLQIWWELIYFIYSIYRESFWCNYSLRVWRFWSKETLNIKVCNKLNLFSK